MSSSALLVVPPFECAWLVDDDLLFPQPSRGCIAFEACADNDVTVVFKEKAGSKHYRTDVGPNYAIVLGSHRNRRLRIEVDGCTVVDVPGMVVSPSHFERFWISVCDGLITVGKGDPGKGVFFQWTDCNPIRKVRYVGLSSWDKHVGYRNIRVLPYARSVPFSATLAHNSITSGGLAQFLENPVFSDLQFCVGADQRIVPAHRLVLACCCTKFPGSLQIVEDVIMLSSVVYPVLHALLQFFYTGRTQVFRPHLAAVQELCEEFGVETLATQCAELQSSSLDEQANGQADSVVLVYRPAGGFGDPQLGFSADTPMDSSKLRDLFVDGEFTDVEILLDGYDVVARAHRLVLSVWSIPFAKMLSNGMWESNMTKINIRDVQPDVFLAMLGFMYTVNLDLSGRDDIESLLLSLLLLADQFNIPLLQQVSTQQLLEFLSEECVCPILQVAASLQACESLQDACVEFFAKHFERCLSYTMEFKELGFSTFKRILQVPDLCVTTEERVLNATVLWASSVGEVSGWSQACDYLKEHNIDSLFGERLDGLNEMLPYVRFALLPLSLLKELESCTLVMYVPRLKELVREALEYLAPEKDSTCCQE